MKFISTQDQRIHIPLALRMKELPPGFQLHQGLDGLIVGLTIVFLVRVEMLISEFIDWRLVPQWTYEPIKSGLSGLGSGIRSGIGAFSGPFGVEFAGGGGGTSAGSGLPLGNLSTEMIDGFFNVIGFPVYISGALSASLIEQLLIIIGMWIAILVPSWCWGFRPLLFWWRSPKSS